MRAKAKVKEGNITKKYSVEENLLTVCVSRNETLKNIY
jgi:hypothetical protein